MKKKIFNLESEIVIIKIGSSLLIKNEKFNFKWFESLVLDICNLRKKQIKVIIVASGAVSLGKNYLEITNKKNLRINEKQACAACGQSILMKNFNKAFMAKNIKIGQILLTFSETENRKKSLNARDTIQTLLESNIIPIINENDSVAIDELKFGDNDRLAARVAQIIGADTLILLSDVDGLYDSNPKKNKNARLIKRIDKINNKILKMAGNQTNLFGSGGMKTKIEASEIASSFGCKTLIFSGVCNRPIQNFLKNFESIGTIISAESNNSSYYKKWLFTSINILGHVVIDKGASKALKQGSSLLPSGVVKVEGNFSRGDIVEVRTEDKELLGKGLIFYDIEEAKLIIGKKTSEFIKVLGYIGKEELIHRDNLILRRED
tara:strand:+ start:807 stop:1940 length:1134 start_codon:yes stop_codon:yes gene_type:complete